MCKEYVGIACIDGSCPVANNEEYCRMGEDTVSSCADCWLHRGCEDCMREDCVFCGNTKPSGTRTYTKISTER